MATAPASDSSRELGVSIVIPAFNYAQFLPKALNSALNQTGPPFEVIVVDDGSTDNTREVVAQYGDRVRYIYQKNSGLAASRNTGIRAARFDYLAFLDADDEWLPGFLSTLIAKLHELPDEFAVVACRDIYVKADGQRIAMKQLTAPTAREITCRDILLKTQFSADAVVVKRSAFDQCGLFDETLRSSEDRDMWLRIAARRRIFLLAERLALIRKHGNNMSKQADRMKGTGRRVINKGWAAELVPHHCFGFWLGVLSIHFFQAAWMYHEENRRGCALRDLAKSVMVWPWFLHPREFNEPLLFRLRTLRHFLMGPRRT